MSVLQSDAEPDALQDTFDWLAPRYLHQTHRISWGRYAAWMNQLQSLVAQWHPRSLVDLGCGPGYLLHRLQREGRIPDLLGIDYAPAMLASVPAGIPTEQQSILTWCRNAQGRVFDVIVLSFVLRDQPDALDVLQAIKRRLADHGHVVVLETHTPKGARRAGFHTYFYRVLPWWGDHSLTADWPGPPERAPYRLLSESHRRWENGPDLRTRFALAGYPVVHRHTPETAVVGLWSAQLDEP